MGKRKSGADINKTLRPSELVPNSAHLELQLEQRSCDQAESSATRPLLSIMDVTGSSLNRLRGQQSSLNEDHGSSHGILLRQSRHYLGRHYSRRSLTNCLDASPSAWMESREFRKLKRIRSSSSASNALVADMQKTECRICHKLLRKKFVNYGNSISSSELSVVAVLVCGHVYHADCLELKTSHEDRQDPPCPLCKSQLS